jgi:hypothetical protein
VREVEPIPFQMALKENWDFPSMPYLNRFVYYKTMELMNAMNFPAKIEFFDILN